MSFAAAVDEQQTQRLTFPLSPDYCASWTPDRALAELVANSRDDDPDFTFSWADGMLTIEDDGLGVPEEGLVLGWSSKRGSDSDQFIGTHGEGLKLSTLVLARDPAIGEVIVETVGYGFVPTVTTNGRLVPVGGRRATTGGTQMLAYDFFETERTRGTKITVQCSEKLAETVRQRFRFLTDPDYQAPAEHGTVLAETGGRLYIGGVLVTANPKLLFSYDFSLAAAKRCQNRDRTVLEANEVDRLIRDALVHLDDPALVKQWVRAALDGRLHRSEQAFSTQPMPGQRRALRAIAKDMFAGRKVTWSSGYQDEEAVLDLRDRGYDILKANALPQYGQRNFFAALGIKAACSIYTAPAAKQHTEWVTRKQLTDAEREILDTAVTMVRGAYGLDAVGACDAYESTCLDGADDDLRWGGFYQPSGAGRIGLQRCNLQSLDVTLDVLVHEAAHRLRHREHGNYDYQDRSRGFEWQLGQMAARALSLAAAGQGIPDPEQAAVKQKRAATAKAKAAAGHPANMMRAVIVQKMDATGLSQADLADACGVSVGTLRQLRAGKYRSWGGRRRPDGAPQLHRTQAVCERVGLEWSVVQLALLSESLWQEPYTREDGLVLQLGFSRRGRKMDHSHGGAGRVNGTRGDEIQACIDRLSAIGTEPGLIAVLQGQLDRRFDGSDGAWLEPYRTLVTLAAA